MSGREDTFKNRIYNVCICLFVLNPEITVKQWHKKERYIKVADLKWPGYIAIEIVNEFKLCHSTSHHGKACDVMLYMVWVVGVFKWSHSCAQKA